MLLRLLYAAGALGVVLLVVALAFVPATFVGGPEPAPPPTTSPTATPMRAVPYLQVSLDRAAEDFYAMLLTLTKLAVLPLLLLLVLRSVRLAFPARPGLVVDEIADGTGEKVLGGSLPGLTALGRDQLRTYLKTMPMTASRGVPKAPGVKLVSDADDLKDLLGAVKDVAPTHVQAILTLLQQLLPRTMTRVSMRLVCLGNGPGKLGLVVSINRANGDSYRATLWEQQVPNGDKRDRANSLVRTVMRWVALEIWADEPITKDPDDPYPEDVRRAIARNRFGWELFELAARHGADLYVRAEHHYRRAVEENATWYLPHRNLGDTLSARGIAAAAADPELSDPRLQERSVEAYDAALAALRENGTVVPSTDPPVLRAITNQIKLSRAISLRLLGDPLRTGLDDVTRIEEEIVSGAERDDEVIYTLACWYATLWRLGAKTDVVLTRIGRYIGTSLVLQHAKYGDWPASDPDLSSVPGVRDLLRELDRTLAAAPDLSSAEMGAIQAAVDRTLAAAGWPVTERWDMILVVTS